MDDKLLYVTALFLLLTSLESSSETKKMIIHVPYNVKNVKHTHTIYKIIPYHHESNHEHENYNAYRKR